MTAPRSWLFVSGARPEHFSKALDTDADAVIFDLEDSVPDGAKVDARHRVAAFLSDNGDDRTFVRINAATTENGRADLDALTGLPIGGVRVPKVESAEAVATVARVLGNPTVLVQATIESALGVQALADIAEHEAVGQLCLGEADLAADLRMSNRDWLQPIRIDVVVASRAAGLPGPVQSPYPVIDDLEGLADTTRAARSMGFSGRSALHPSQVAVINAAHQPSAAESEQAQQILRLLNDSEAAGRAAAQLADGRFVDLSTARAAEAVITATQNPSTAVHRHDHHRKGETQ